MAYIGFCKKIIDKKHGAYPVCPHYNKDMECSNLFKAFVFEKKELENTSSDVLVKPAYEIRKTRFQKFKEQFFKTK